MIFLLINIIITVVNANDYYYSRNPISGILAVLGAVIVLRYL